MTEQLLLGHSINYWLELDRRMKESPDFLDKERLLNEVVTLYGKLEAIRQRITEAASILS